MPRVARSSLVVLLVVLFLLAAACGDEDDDTTAGGTGAATTAEDGDDGDDGDDKAGAGKKVGLVYDIGGPGDNSFNDSAAEGLDRATDEFGIESRDLSPSAGGENREELLRLLSQSGFELNFAIGFASKDATTKVAGEFPDVMYGQIDEVVDLPNVASLTFAEHEGSYLMGAAAALTSKTNRIGLIGGVDTARTKRFEAGYVAGAKKIKPDITIDVKYISAPLGASGNDPAQGKELGAAMYAAGADVVYHAAGGSGTGLFEAAKEASSEGTKKWAIGVDGDQHESADPSVRGVILTSMLKNVNVALFDAIEKFVNGELGGGHTEYGLKDGGVDYATSGGFVDSISSQLDDLKQQIISGAIMVPTAP